MNQEPQWRPDLSSEDKQELAEDIAATLRALNNLLNKTFAPERTHEQDIELGQKLESALNELFAFRETLKTVIIDGITHESDMSYLHCPAIQLMNLIEGALSDKATSDKRLVFNVLKKRIDAYLSRTESADEINQV